MNSKSIESAYKPRFSFSPLAYERNSIMAQCKSVHSTMRKKENGKKGKTDKIGRKALDHKRGRKERGSFQIANSKRVQSAVTFFALPFDMEMSYNQRLASNLSTSSTAYFPIRLGLKREKSEINFKCPASIQ